MGNSIPQEQRSETETATSTAVFGIGPAFFLQAGAFFVAALLALALPETKGKQLA